MNMQPVWVYQSPESFQTPRNAAAWNEIELDNSLDFERLDYEVIEARAALVRAFPYGQGVYFDDRCAAYMNRLMTAGCGTRVWQQARVDSRTAANGLAKIMLFEETRRLAASEDLYEAFTTERPRRGVYGHGPLELYQQAHGDYPPGDYQISVQQRTLTAALNRRIDPLITEKLTIEEAGQSCVPLSHVARPLMQRCGLTKQLQAELELYRIATNQLSPNRASAFQWSLREMYRQQ